MSDHNTPWETFATEESPIPGEWAIDDANGRVFAYVVPIDDEPTAEHRAKHIVQAVNGPSALITVLAELIELKTATESEELDGPMENWFPAKEIDRRWNAARAALALARNGVTP